MSETSEDFLMDEHTKEIVEYIPNALQRWGVFAIVAVLFALLAGTYFVWCPETLEGQVIIPVSKSGAVSSALMYVKPSNMGEIAKGAKVIIFTEEYPESKYGFLKGHVSHVNGIPDGNGLFKIEVSLQEGLRTSSGYRLSPHIQLSGTGEIFVHERRLLEAIVKPLK